MTDAALKNWLGIGLIVTHLLILFVLLGLWVRGGYLFEEMTTAVALILPMLATYTAGVIRHLVHNKDVLTASGKRINAPYVIATMLVLFAFFGSMLAVVVMKAYNIGFASFEQFKIVLALLQSAFGIYAIQILSPLYELQADNTSKKRKAGSSGKA